MRSVMTLAAVVLVVLSVSVANATIIGTYVEADETNTANAQSPGSSWGTTVDSNTDNLWETDQGSGSSHESYTVFYDRDYMAAYHTTENVPMIVTTISGLTSGNSYEVRLLFGSHTDLRNQIYAGLSSSALGLYNDTNSDLETAGELLYEGGYHNRYQVLLGTAVADVAGTVKVYVESAPDLDDDYFTFSRTVYDGLAHYEIPEPSTLVLLACGLAGLLCYAWRKRR